MLVIDVWQNNSVWVIADDVHSLGELIEDLQMWTQIRLGRSRLDGGRTSVTVVSSISSIFSGIHSIQSSDAEMIRKWLPSIPVYHTGLQVEKEILFILKWALSWQLHQEAHKNWMKTIFSFIRTSSGSARFHQRVFSTTKN